MAEEEIKLEIRAKVTRFPYFNEEYRNETFDVEKIPHPTFDKTKDQDYSKTIIRGIYNIEVEFGGTKQADSFTYKTEGNHFEHTMKMKGPMGEMKFKVKGKVEGKVEGDTITGVFKVMMLSMPFSGKRVSTKAINLTP